MEGTLRSVEPLAYYVNTLSDFDAEVVTAYKKKDNKKNQAARLHREDGYGFIHLCEQTMARVYLVRSRG